MQSEIEGFIRVSQVLDWFQEPELVAWMIRKGPEAKKLSKQAMKVGTEVDEAVKQFVATGIMMKKKRSTEVQSCLDGFSRWYMDYKPKLTIGTRLFNVDLKITGEPDLYWNDRILDIKCASAIRPKYHIQTGAYAWLGRNETTGILRLHKQLSDYEYVERNGKEVEEDKQTFSYLLKVYNYFNKPLLVAGDKDYEYHPTDNSF